MIQDILHDLRDAILQKQESRRADIAAELLDRSSVYIFMLPGPGFPGCLARATHQPQVSSRKKYVWPVDIYAAI